MDTGTQKLAGLSNRQEKATVLVAADDLTNEQIAREVGVTRHTLDKWKLRPAFISRVQEHREAWRQIVYQRGIALRENRIAILDKQLARLMRTLDARAADPLVANVPGGIEGVLVAEPVLIKVYDARTEGTKADDESLQSRRDSVVMYKYAVDVGTLKEIRETMKQTAIEVGEWTEKQDVTSGGQQVSFTLKLSNDDSVRVHSPAPLSEAE